MPRDKKTNDLIPKESKRSLSRDNTETVEPKYCPMIIEIEKPKENIFDEEADIKFSTNIDYSRFSYGFHHFIHANKNKMEILKQFEGKKKVYLVMNDFERYIDNYDKSIGDETKNYFNLGKKPDVLSRAFYKLWEILCMFDLIDKKNPKFVSAHLAEGPGSFIQATMFYRDYVCKKDLSKNDKYYAVTLHSEDAGVYIVPEMEQKFVDYYEHEKPQRFFMHKTYTKQVAGGNNDKDNGDITDPKTIKLFGGQMSEKAHLITGDGGFEWANENIQEQEAFKLILSQIVAATKLQAHGGNFVCKFFETFSTTSAKLISMLTQLYNHVYFVKPLTSRSSNSEKYAVCMGFKFSEKDNEYKKITKKLDHLLELSHKSGNMKMVDLFTSYHIPQSISSLLIQLNTTIANRQLKSINEIVSFIKAQNFYGDQYQERREQQIVATQFWLKTFYPNRDNTEESEKNITNMKKYSLNINKNGADGFSKSITY